MIKTRLNLKVKRACELTPKLRFILPANELIFSSKNDQFRSAKIGKKKRK